MDTGCLCYSVIDENLARKYDIKLKSIDPMRLQLANGKCSTRITHMANLMLDIDGRQERMWSYVVPDLAYPMILGKPWLEQNDVYYMAKRRCIRFGSRKHGLIVHASDWYEKGAPAKVRQRLAQLELNSASLTSGPVFAKLVKKARKLKNALIGSISMHDITKALEHKKVESYEEVKSMLPKEIQHYTEIFLDDDKRSNTLPPHRKGIDTKIDLEKENDGREKEVPWGPLYGMSRGELLVLRKTLSDLLDKNWIRASSSPGGAPVLFTKKPGGGLRFCVDYRALNTITVRDRYPLPLIKETMRMISGAKWFSKVDVRAAFHRLRVAEGDEYKTAFRTRFGAYEWLVTPFGLAGAPAAFQRWINTVLEGLLGDICSAYIDDVLIFSDGDLRDHWVKVDLVMQRLAEAGLKLDPKKCEFATKKTKYLGFIIETEKGVGPDPEKVRAITEWQRPTDVKGIRSFLGFANFYRDFIDNFAKISAPLHELTKKGTPFLWGTSQNDAFEMLKLKFKSAPTLAMWQENKITVLETDASGWATGGCLSQYNDKGELQPIAYHSKKLTPTECNYMIHDKELLAIIRCVVEWRAELIGLQDPFIILTDHRNLEYFMTTKNLSERQVRWSEILSQYNFRLKFRPGKKATRPDALSRRPQDVPQTLNDPRLKEREFKLIRNEWIEKDNEILLTPLRMSNHNKIPEGKQIFEKKELQPLWDEGVSKDEILKIMYETVYNKKDSFPTNLGLKTSIGECEIDARGALCFRNRLWIPDWEPLRTTLIQQTHDSHATGHPGRNSTFALLSRSFFWPGMSNMVRQFCRNCDVCGRSHVWRSRKQGLLLPLPIPDRFHSELSIDFMTDLPTKDKGDPRFLMVITDRLLKSVTLEAMTSMSAEECADRFIQCHYRFHGFPKALTSDRGSNWVGDFWKRLCKIAGIEQRLSTAYHPETDGATERMNQEILAYLRAYISFAQTEWSRMLPSAQIAINNRDSSITGLSPFFLEHGYHIEPIQMSLSTKNEVRTPPAKRAERFMKRLHEAQEYAAAAMAAAQQAMEEQANKSRNPCPKFCKGDKVWLNLKNIQTPQPKKKLAWVSAKYTVTKVISPHVMELDVPSGIHPRFHVQLLRRAGEDPLPSQTVDDLQPPPILPENVNSSKNIVEPEQYVERILRAERFRRGRKWVRRVLVKWRGFIEPNWEDRDNLENNVALDEFESKYGLGDGIGEDEGARQGSTRSSRAKRRKAGQMSGASP